MGEVAPGRADDDCGGGESFLDPIERQGCSTERARELLGLAERSIRDGELLDPTLDHVACREGPHFTDSDEEHGMRGEILENLAGELRGGARDRNGARADLGLVAHSLSDGHRGLQDPVEHVPACLALERKLVGAPHLAQNLRFSENERIEPSRHSQEVAD